MRSKLLVRSTQMQASDDRPWVGVLRRAPLMGLRGSARRAAAES